MSNLFGGGSGSNKNAGNAGGGYYLTGGGANAPFEMGPTPFDIQAIESSVGNNQQAIANRYDQLGEGGATLTPAPAPTTTTTPATTTTTPHTATGTSIGDLALQAINALGGNLPAFANTPGFANLFFGIPGDLLSGTGQAGTTDFTTPATTTTTPSADPSTATFGTFSGGSTMEQQDLAGAANAGTALLGQEQGQDVTNPALNPSLQTPINQLVGVMPGGGTSGTASALSGLGTAIGAGSDLSSLLSGSGAASGLGDVATGALALGLP